MSKYNRKLIEGAIISYFGSKKKCAEALGFSESTLSRNLKNLPEPFIQRLKGIGVVVGKNITKDSATSYITGGDVNQSGKEVKYLLRKIIELEEANLKLKEELGKYSST